MDDGALAGESFTLRAGGAVLVNMLPDADQHFRQYDIGFVDGPPEPRETPTVAPTRGPWRAYLPLVFDRR